MSTVVFLGPTLPVERAADELAATYLPPARQGDVLRALSRGARRIGIIDGYFDHVPSVSHKEILFAMERGATVYGASSMGALRAAELHGFGMIGLGTVFEWYRDGVLVDDDEVAVVHAPSDRRHVPLSEAMVNVRDCVTAAVGRGLVTEPVGAALVAIAKAMFFRERSYRAVLAVAQKRGLPEQELAAFEAFAAEHEPVKRRDAIQLLRRMRESTSEPVRERVHAERTYFLQALSNGVELELAREHLGSSALSEGDPAALNPLKKKALLRLLAMRHAEELGMPASAEEIQQMADDFRRTRELITEQQMLGWMASRGLTLERFSDAIRELATVRKLEAHYALEVEQRIPDHIRLGLGAEADRER